MMWRIATLSAACLALCGCRVDPNVPILERELRLQEDKIYQLEGQLAEHRAALESCRRQAGGATGVCPLPAGPPAAVGPLLGPAAKVEPSEPVVPQPPIVELPGQPQTQMPDSLRSKIAPPAIEVPTPPPGKAEPKAAPPSAAAPRPRTKAIPAAAAVETAAEPAAKPAAKPAADASTVATRPTSNDPVERIVLNLALSGGLNADGKPGDEGLSLLIEPQDAQGRSVERAAPITVVVLDRQVSGDAARVARWDFSAEQVAKKFRHTSVGSGVYLELPWPVAPPAHSELHAFVRYVPADGRLLEAEMPLTIELPGQPKQWTAAQPGAKFTRLPVVADTAPASTPIAAAKPAPAPKPEAIPTPPSRPQARRPVWSPTR